MRFSGQHSAILQQLFNHLAFVVLSVVGATSCTANSNSNDMKIPLRVGVTEVKKVVHQTCAYEIGLSFSPKIGGVDSIRKVFGGPMEVNLPAEVSILVTHSEGTEVLALKHFGGRGLGFRYGPPIRFVAGTRRLAPGTYSVRVELTELVENLSTFESHVFIDKPPKIICGG